MANRRCLREGASREPASPARSLRFVNGFSAKQLGRYELAVAELRRPATLVFLTIPGNACKTGTEPEWAPLSWLQVAGALADVLRDHSGYDAHLARLWLGSVVHDVCGLKTYHSIMDPEHPCLDPLQWQGLLHYFLAQDSDDG